MFRRRIAFTLCVFTAWSVLSGPVASGGEPRIWTDKSGRFQVEAALIKVDGDKVLLERADGRRIEVRLSQLSEQDQVAIRSAAAATADNPFRVLDDSDAATPDRIIEPSWSDAAEVPIAAGDRWDVVLGDPASLSFEPRIAGLPKKTDFFESISGMAVDASGKHAAVSYSLGGRGPNAKVTSRIVVLDMASGKLLANTSLDGHFVIIAMHDDGKQMVAEEVVTSGPFGREKQHVLVTLALNGSKVALVKRWVPYSNVDEGGRHVRFAEFARGGKLVTCNEPGVVAVWDFASLTLDFFFQIPRTSIPALSPDRQYVGFAGGNKVGIVNLETREPAAMKAADDMTFWVKGAFSPSGKRFAASSQQKLMIWDVATGEVVFEGDIPGIALAYGLHFPAEDFVLLSNETLVEWASGIKVWQYSGGGPRRTVGGFTYIAADAVVPVEMPHAEAKRLLEEAKKESDLFVVKKGTPLAIDVTEVPQQYQNEVKESLAKQIQGINCTLAASAPVTVKAIISGPKEETVSYFSAGSFVMNKYTSTIQFEFQGKTIWSSSQSNVPGALTSPREKSYQQQIDEAGAKPNLRFFGYANFPEYLQRPAASSTSAGGQQTLGVSKVSATGLN